MITKLCFTIITFLALTTVVLGQNREEKTVFIINKLDLAAPQEQSFRYQLGFMKLQATGADSIKVLALEQLLANDTITKLVIASFNEVFTDEEINDLYLFVQTSAFSKLVDSVQPYKLIVEKIVSFENEFDKLRAAIKAESQIKSDIFKFIPIERENGFYTTVNYNPSEPYDSMQLELKPFLTLKDFAEIKKTEVDFNDSFGITIIFTAAGANKFTESTKNNIGRPIAIVIGNNIIAAPMVMEPVDSGQVIISDYFTEEDVEKLINLLRGK